MSLKHGACHAFRATAPRVRTRGAVAAPPAPHPSHPPTHTPTPHPLQPRPSHSSPPPRTHSPTHPPTHPPSHLSPPKPPSWGNRPARQPPWGYVRTRGAVPHGGGAVSSHGPPRPPWGTAWRVRTRGAVPHGGRGGFISWTVSPGLHVSRGPFQWVSLSRELYVSSSGNTLA